MTIDATAIGVAEPTATLAEYLPAILRSLPVLPSLSVDLVQAHGHLIAEVVAATSNVPAVDSAAIDGYAVRSDDLSGPGVSLPARLSVVGHLSAAGWRPVAVAPGTCYTIAAGAAMPTGADIVAAPHETDAGPLIIEVGQRIRRGCGVMRAGQQVRAGAVIAAAGTAVTPALVAVLAATGSRHVPVRPIPRVGLLATGDELVDPGRGGVAGQVVDANSLALAAAVVEAGAYAVRLGICDDDPRQLRQLLEEQVGRVDLLVTTGGTGIGESDVVRRLGGDAMVTFTDVSLFACSSLGFGAVAASPASAEQTTLICLPGDPGAALIAFEVLVRPVIRRLAGADPVYRPSVKATLLETVESPIGQREFRPVRLVERRGGGHTATPLPGGPYTLSGLALANGLMVLGERVGHAPAGSTVDVLVLDRRG